MVSSGRHIKISVSMPLHLVEKLDKKTTYKGKSRSQYIAKAVSDRINSLPATSTLDTPTLLTMLCTRYDLPRYLLILIREYNQYPLDELGMGLED
jgi:hypothetical protein